MIAPKSPDIDRICQIRVVLKDSDPPIWRRVLAPAAYTLGDLHSIIQAVMPWTDSHMHEFLVGDVHYGAPDREFEADVQEEEDISLAEAFRGRQTCIEYAYDFGDGWDHFVELEAIVQRDPAQEYPRCVGGENACPPENSGSMDGYYDKLRILADPKGPQHPFIKDWMPLGFDPTAFSVEKANILLRMREEDDDAGWVDADNEAMAPARLDRICAWCRKEISDSRSALSRGVQASEGVDTSRLEGSFVVLNVGSAMRQVPARVATADSQAKREGKDLIITVCGEKCASLLDVALQEDVAMADGDEGHFLA
ncbi:MAG: plasmid pRiA4b ORF-3 family protein [Verrucomicrobiota bacterium]|nr:plasmid pRiA4b ORF-3 family protein [Verrucomicrobiota bacterium]